MRFRAFVVSALVALVALASCKDEKRIRREEALKQNPAVMRQAIANYRRDHGRYPGSLNDLVPNYVRRLPTDPITEAVDWRVTTEETVQPNSDFQTTTTEAAKPVVIDVHSSAPGADRNGVPYANY